MNIRGYDFDSVDLSPGHICSLCVLGMQNPVQTSKCGHHFCEECFFKALRHVCDYAHFPHRPALLKDIKIKIASLYRDSKSDNIFFSSIA